MQNSLKSCPEINVCVTSVSHTPRCPEINVNSATQERRGTGLLLEQVCANKIKRKLQN